MSNKIVLNELQFELIHYLFLSSVFAQFYRDFYFKYENVNNHAHA
jgi:hypothetical protein